MWTLRSEQPLPMSSTLTAATCPSPHHCMISLRYLYYFTKKSFNKEKITCIYEYASYAYFLQSLTKPKRNYKIMKTENMPRHILFTLITIVHTYEKLSLAPHFRNPIQCQIRSTERQAQKVRLCAVLQLTLSAVPGDGAQASHRLGQCLSLNYHPKTKTILLLKAPEDSALHSTLPAMSISLHQMPIHTPWVLL